jgi:tetratricopeptide (TPR) repeat protein
MYTREYDRAIAQFNHTYALDPEFVLSQWYLGLVFEQLGRYSEAETAFRKALLPTHDDLIIRADAAHLYAVSGQREMALRELAELEQISKTKYVSSFGLALICAGLRDDYRAFEYFDQALKARSDMMVYLNVDPRFDRLRVDPRFKSLVKKVGLPRQSV